MYKCDKQRSDPYVDAGDQNDIGLNKTKSRNQLRALCKRNECSD